MELSLNRGVSLEHAPSHELFSRTPLMTREPKRRPTATRASERDAYLSHNARPATRAMYAVVVVLVERRPRGVAL
jgi:hypothetical protein